MVPNNTLGLHWPTIRFFLDMKSTWKKRKQEFLSFVFRKRELFFVKPENFLTFRNKNPGTFNKSLKNHKMCLYISTTEEYIDILKIIDF